MTDSNKKYTKYEKEMIKKLKKEKDILEDKIYNMEKREIVMDVDFSPWCMDKDNGIDWETLVVNVYNDDDDKVSVMKCPIHKYRELQFDICPKEFYHESLIPHGERNLVNDDKVIFGSSSTMNWDTVKDILRIWDGMVKKAHIYVKCQSCAKLQRAVSVREVAQEGLEKIDEKIFNKKKRKK